MTRLGLRPAPTTPWIVDIDVFQSHANTNWATNTVSSALFHNGYSQSTGVQNAEIAWDVVLGAGTWTCQITHRKDINLGIASIQLDTVEVGTADFYNGSALNNQTTIVPGIVVATTGKKRCSLKMSARNASNVATPGYYGQIQHIQWRRTA